MATLIVRQPAGPRLYKLTMGRKEAALVKALVGRMVGGGMAQNIYDALLPVPSLYRNNRMRPRDGENAQDIQAFHFEERS